ncbi:hypothetical protein L208DRAFT_1000181, partial [Tricholoma matsutake]
LFKTNCKMTLMNGDVCHIGVFVIAQSPDVLGQTRVAWVDKIVQIKGSVFNLSNQANIILLQTVNASDAAEQYWMPRIQLLHHWFLANPKDLLCTVNAPHNCAKQQCKATGHQNVYQEQQLTTQT